LVVKAFLEVLSHHWSRTSYIQP